MAAPNFSPSGFSYAQAAKGGASAVASQSSSSKVTSGTASPATGTLSELTTGSNWADDVEGSGEDKTSEPLKAQQDQNKSSQSRERLVERANSEDKMPNGTPSATTPDTTASTKEDYLSSAPVASSSETTWDTKSQTSEPAWITDRTDRQAGVQSNEGNSKAEKKNKDTAMATALKPAFLQDAPPPTVNPWQKRAQEAKARMGTLPRPPSTTDAPDTSTPNEIQRSRPDSRRKANSIASIPHESLPNATSDVKKANRSRGKHNNDVGTSDSQQDSKPKADGSRSDSPQAAATKAVPSDASSLPTSTNARPLVKDEVSWPTPDSALDKERKEVTEKDAEEKRVEDVTPTMKRKKPEWKAMAVVPNIIWETQSANDRNKASRTTSSPATQDTDSSADARGRPDNEEQETAPQPAKPTRASSASSYRDRKQGFRPDRINRGQSLTETTQLETGASDATNTAAGGATKTFFEAVRAKSPSKMDTAGSENNFNDFVPKPIPRRSSVGTQTQEPADGAPSAAQESGRSRVVPADGRKEARGFESAREPLWNGPRGSKRGGRGRGGNAARDLANGHPGPHTYGNNYVPEFVPPSPYGVPPTPAYPTQRGNHQYAYAQPVRGGWTTRGSLRSQSIPVDNVYSQRYGGYAAAQPQLPPIQTYVPGMYDPNGVPVTAMPYPAQMDPNYLIEIVCTQLEYYFSVDNLLKDMFLRKHMDSQGFVILDVVANFNRVKQLTQDKDLIKTACINSAIIEIRVGEDGKERLRRRDGWEQFLLPMEQREEGAQNAGPAQLERPERPQLPPSNIPPQYRGPASAGVPPMPPRFDRRSYDSIYPVLNGVSAPYSPYGGGPEAMYTEMMNEEEMRGRAAKSPIHETVMSPVDQPAPGAADEHGYESDSFSDEQVSMLTVVVKMNQQRLPYHSLASRTFSNGSIDSRSIQVEMEKSAESSSQPKPNGELIANGSDRLPAIPRNLTPNKARSVERTSPSVDMNVFWVKDHDIPISNLPPDLTSEPYEQLRLKALDQRNQAATGTCPYDLDVLYQFWCHFLIRNFNNHMYSQFKYYANEDARERHNFTGLNNLVKFYAQALSSHNPIRDRVVRDYVELVKNEQPKLEGTAFKQLRSAWRNGALNLKNRKKLADIVDDKLKEQLDRLET